MSDPPAPYLMLVTFGAPHLARFAPKELARLNDSPYDGIAAIVRGADDMEAVPARDSFRSVVEAVRAGTKRHVWPWVFSNRFIGQSETSGRHLTMPAIEYFRSIGGWDLDDDRGALSAWYGLWRVALQLSRDLGAPGVVLDLEAYNDYTTYDVDHLAALRRETPDATAKKVRSVGREMARIVAEEYPDALIWSLFCDLGTGRAPDLLCRGFLDEVARLKIDAVLIDGGESPIGYYNPSVESLDRKIDRFLEALRPFVERYPGHLRMGGTIAPYHEPERLEWWIKEASEKGGRTYANAEEFRPLFDLLFHRCEAVWVYGAIAAHYNPFDPTDSASAAAIERVLAHAKAART